MPDAIRFYRAHRLQRKGPVETRVFLLFPQLPQILKESRNLRTRSRRMAGGCGCMVVLGAFASHDPDQHTLQARSASRIEDGLVEKKKQQSHRIRKR